MQQLNVDMDEVEDLLIGLILEGKVEGKIDQVSMRLELTTKYVTPLRYSCSILNDHAGRVSRRSGTTHSTSGPTHSSPCTTRSSARRRPGIGGQTQHLAPVQTRSTGPCVRWRG